jgi:hypothetical protein
MDLNAINATIKESTEVEIIHPKTGEGGWFLEIATPGNRAAQARVMSLLDQMRKRKVSTPGQDERDGVELLAARVLGWRGLTSGDGPVPYSHEACVALLADTKAFWVRAQIMEAIGDPSRPFGN